MIGIALVEAARIVDQDGVDFEMAEQENQACPHLDDGPGVHVVVWIIQENGLLEAEPPCHFARIDFVFGGDFPVADSVAGHRIVGEGDQNAFVTLIDKFQHRAAGEDGDVVAMRLNGGQHFPLCGFPLPFSAR